jgi:uncharacterized phage protein (TIGR01671 family)
MRTILFRGKTISTGVYGDGWVQGDLTHSAIDIWCVATRVVDPATVGQYTGLKDRNGKMIFEGDILGFDRNVSHGLRYYVKFVKGAFWAVGTHREKGGTEFGDILEEQLHSMNEIFIGRKSFRIIGNVHDNPKLMEAK